MFEQVLFDVDAFLESVATEEVESDGAESVESAGEDEEVLEVVVTSRKDISSVAAKMALREGNSWPRRKAEPRRRSWAPQ